MSVVFPGSTAGGSTSLLPALLGIVVAVLLWVGGDDWHAQLPEVQQRLRLASAMVSRGGADEVSKARSSARAVHDERAALAFRLQTTEPEPMIRARLLHTLRQACAASGAAACTVRLAEEAAALRSAPASAATARGADATLQDLGIAKTRAIVSATFTGPELDKLLDSLAADMSARWRVNGIVVRNNTFELDIERHQIPPRSVAGAGS